MFADRADAGIRLAHALREYKAQPVVVYALPRGGVVPGAKVAEALQAPLDLILVRKIGHPESPEYAVGALSEYGDIIINSDEASVIDPSVLEDTFMRESREMARQRNLFLAGREREDAKDRVAIIVDDGLATGLTMEAAIQHVRNQQPARIVVAVPVGASETIARLRPQVDEVVVLHVPGGNFGAVGSFYRNFEQVSDDEVIALLQRG